MNKAHEDRSSGHRLRSLCGVTAPSMAVTPPPMNDAVVVPRRQMHQPRHAHDADGGKLHSPDRSLRRQHR